MALNNIAGKDRKQIEQYKTKKVGNIIDAKKPRAPKHLGERQRKIFHDIVRMLGEHDLITELDAYVIADYAQLRVLKEAVYEKIIDENGEIRAGIPNDQVRLYYQLQNACTRNQELLPLSPKSRSTIDIPKGRENPDQLELLLADEDE